MQVVLTFAHARSIAADLVVRGRMNLVRASLTRVWASVVDGLKCAPVVRGTVVPISLACRVLAAGLVVCRRALVTRVERACTVRDWSHVHHGAT